MPDYSKKALPAPPPAQWHGHTAHIRVNVKSHQHDDGSSTLEIPMRGLNPEEQKTLKSLFPTLGEMAHELLLKEAVLQAITDRRG